MIASRSRLEKQKKGKLASEPIPEPAFKVVAVAMPISRYIAVAEPAHSPAAIAKPAPNLAAVAKPHHRST
jgi:hypothetical protein